VTAENIEAKLAAPTDAASRALDAGELGTIDGVSLHASFAKSWAGLTGLSNACVAPSA
jgi:hypothetical protein